MRYRPRAIARAKWKGLELNHADELTVEDSNLGEEWLSSFRDFKSNEYDAQAQPVAAPPQPEEPQLVDTHPEQDSDMLQDMLELAQIGSVRWPPGLDAKVAQSILESRAAQAKRRPRPTPPQR